MSLYEAEGDPEGAGCLHLSEKPKVRMASAQRLWSLLVAVGMVVTLSAQTPKLAFEVASVKANKSGDVFVRFPPGGPRRYQMINVPLRMLIQVAFDVQSVLIVNAPDWTQNERFDITAKIPEDVQLARGVEAAMLRALLDERFKLVTHRETRELPVYALVRARADGKLSPALEPASPECAPGGRRRLGPGPDGRPQLPPPGQRPCDTSGGPGSITTGSMAMEAFARALSGRMERIVLDRTGLAGEFQFELTFTPERIPNVDGNLRPSSRPSIRTDHRW